DYDTTVAVWEPAARRLQHTLRGHASVVRHVAFSPDGRLLASASDDQTVRVWDADGGRLLITLRGHAVGVRRVAFSPDSRLVLSEGSGEVKLWDLLDVEELRTLSGWGSLAFSPDSRLVAAAARLKPRGCAAQAWDVVTGQKDLTVRTEGASGAGMVFAPDGGKLVWSNSGRGVTIWDPATGEERLTLPGVPGLGGVVIGGDTRRLAAAYQRPEGKEVRVWDTTTGQELRVFRDQESAWGSWTFSPDGVVLAVATGSSGVVRLQDLATGQELLTLRAHRGEIEALAFSTDGKRLATA